MGENFFPTTFRSLRWFENLDCTSAKLCSFEKLTARIATKIRIQKVRIFQLQTVQKQGKNANANLMSNTEGVLAQSP